MPAAAAETMLRRPAAAANCGPVAPIAIMGWTSSAEDRLPWQIPNLRRARTRGPWWCHWRSASLVGGRLAGRVRDGAPMRSADGNRACRPALRSRSAQHRLRLPWHLHAIAALRDGRARCTSTRARARVLCGHAVRLLLLLLPCLVQMRALRKRSAWPLSTSSPTTARTCPLSSSATLLT